jgi:heme/copper-type cytochrome/quinol oxidase subunit 4
VNWVMALGAETLTTLGITLVAIAISLTWMLHPRDRKEARIMQMPAAWIIFPLLIIVCLLSGGGLIYVHIAG